MRKRGSFFITLGLVLLGAALGLTCYNLYRDQRAAQSADAVAAALNQVLPPPPQPQTPAHNAPEPVIPDYILNPHMDMPEINIDSRAYIGTLSMPAAELELPIISQWSYEDLMVAPCRYSGSAYTGDLVVAAHNYSHHFGRLKNLEPEDAVILTDADGNTFTYRVIEKETLMPTAVEEMTSGTWDLTLFTCTLGGSYRMTIRCELVP